MLIVLIDSHSATKAKIVEGTDLTLSRVVGAPPVMPWREFANWIRMENEHDTVRGWIRNGYLPSKKIGKYVLVNVALLTKQLMEEEWE